LARQAIRITTSKIPVKAKFVAKFLFETLFT
jgi:hypothetical protein